MGSFRFTEEEFERLELAIREGRSDAVRERFKGLTFKNIRRSDRRRLANLARRANLPLVALRILNPVVRAHSSSVIQADHKEKAEYGAALLRVGARAEADALLAEVSEDQVPESLLYRSFCLFAAWDYAEAKTLLQRYVVTPSLNEYQRLVGEVNLLAAEIFVGDIDSAKPRAMSLLKRTSGSGLTLLHDNCLELSAQAAIAQREFAQARGALEKILSRDSQAHFFAHLFARKWLAVVDFLAGATSNTDEFDRISHVAREAQHWETVRDCDLQKALLTADENLLMKIFFGTPHAEYRAHILRRAPGVSVPEFFDLPEGHAKRARVFDTALAHELEMQGSALNAGKSLHRALCVLVSDLYRPISLAGLFGDIFPGEHFNPDSSPNRVHQIVKKLKTWISEEKIPVDLVSEPQGYRLLHGHLYGFRVYRESPVRIESSIDAQCLRLELTFAERIFTNRQAAEVLGLSPSQTSRILREALETGRLRRVSAGANTKFCFAKTLTQRAG